MLLTLMCLAIGYTYAQTTYGPITLEAQDGQRKIYLHVYDTWYGTPQYYISDNQNTELRDAVTVIMDSSQITKDNIYKAWYDHYDTVVYATKNNKLSAVHPVYSQCGLAHEPLKKNTHDMYLGIFPNSNYRMQPSSYAVIGSRAPHCYVYAPKNVHTAQPVEAVSSLILQSARG